MPIDLSTVRRREVLKSRREPYWHRLRPGCFLGYRPSCRGNAGAWIARCYDEDHRGYRIRSLGSFDKFAARDQFATAKKEAEKFAELIESGGFLKSEIETVEQACRAFAVGKPEAEGRFKRHVYSDPIAHVKLSKLRRHHTAAWRRRLEERPARVNRSKREAMTTRPRSPSTVNREQAVLRAALGRVVALGPPNTDAAWQEPLKPIKNATRRRTLYLDREQRRHLLAHAADEIRPFLHALCLLPLRPGAVAHLKVAEFDQRTRELTIGRDKDGKSRRIVLPSMTAEMFAQEAGGKSPSMPLFARFNGLAWDRHSWKKPIAEAARAAELPIGTTAYTLRHSTITDLVTSRLPLLTLAQISGTSVDMIERHYGHLDREAAELALVTLAL